MNECTILVLGATGDLAKRKLIPALYRLIRDNKIQNFALIGAALEKVSVHEWMERAREFIPVIDEELWKILVRNAHYYAMNFDESAAYEQLAKIIADVEKKHELRGNRLAYLAVPSSMFCTITRGLGASNIVRRAGENGLLDGVWQRIVYEKPFGTDLQSAQEINACIHEFFSEKQIYRIDHYLTKELVGSILLLRFTNMFFEPLWNNKYIKEVQIVLSETLGLEGRGRYFDKYGMLKDVVQNHMMQLLSLVAMELPMELASKQIQDQKAAVLKQVHFDTGILGQYKAYHTEKDVARDSQTPTFAALKMSVDTPRWHNVPFYVKTGKRLDKNDVSIHILFKEVSCSFRKQCIYSSNHLTMQISPDASFSIQLNTKRPGYTYEVTPITLFFSHNYVFGTMTPEAYEVLLEQIILGEQSISVRFDEIEYAWSIIESVEKKQLPVYGYNQASKGPQELEEFNKKYGIRWLS